MVWAAESRRIESPGLKANFELERSKTGRQVYGGIRRVLAVRGAGSYFVRFKNSVVRHVIS